MTKSTNNAESAISRQRKTSKRYYHQVCLSDNWCFVPFFSLNLSVVNALSDKAGESDIRLGGGIRFLDMQFQECQYIHVIIVNSYQFMQVLFYLHVCLSAIVYVKEHRFKMHKIHTRRCVSPVVELHMTNHINNCKTIQTNSATVLQSSNTEDRNRKQMLDLDI